MLEVIVKTNILFQYFNIDSPNYFFEQLEAHRNNYSDDCGKEEVILKRN